MAIADDTAPGAAPSHDHHNAAVAAVTALLAAARNSLRQQVRDQLLHPDTPSNQPDTGSEGDREMPETAAHLSGDLTTFVALAATRPPSPNPRPEQVAQWRHTVLAELAARYLTTAHPDAFDHWHAAAELDPAASTGAATGAVTRSITGSTNGSAGCDTDTVAPDAATDVTTAPAPEAPEGAAPAPVARPASLLLHRARTDRDTFRRYAALRAAGRPEAAAVLLDAHLDRAPTDERGDLRHAELLLTAALTHLADQRTTSTAETSPRSHRNRTRSAS